MERTSINALEPRWQDLFPVDTDLPRPSLIGEEDHVVKTFVDVVQQSENDVESLARLRHTKAFYSLTNVLAVVPMPVPMAPPSSLEFEGGASGKLWPMPLSFLTNKS